MKKDIANFKKIYYRDNGGIDCIEVFTGNFLEKFPGYSQLFSRQAIIFEAQKICKITPGQLSRNEGTRTEPI